MDNQSISSAVSDSSELDFDLGSDSVQICGSTESDSSYSNDESYAMYKLMDLDLSDSSTLEDDELAHIHQEQADITSPSKRPSWDSANDYDDDIELNTIDKNDSLHKIRPQLQLKKIHGHVLLDLLPGHWWKGVKIQQLKVWQSYFCFSSPLIFWNWLLKSLHIMHMRTS